MFRTELPIAPATDQLPHTARVLTVGSCFADSIGSRLLANKVDTLANPFGTVFQPLALARLLRAAAGEEMDWQQHLVEARGRWQSYDLHGSIGADSPVDLLQIIQELVRRTGEFLRQADVVLLTLGTAWAYRLRETGELVSNCHKQPADLFVRELLTPDEVVNSLAETHAYLRRINPGLRFVLTISPVRHLKDTLPLNAVSKSVLRVATHVVSDLLPGVAYFPAYELLMDDLRDYRFYAADMLHPSKVAEDYIWEKFARTYFDADFGRFRKEWAAVRQSLEHRPLHPNAPEHRQFLESTQAKLEQLSLRKVAVAAELNEVKTKIAALPVPQQPEPATAAEDSEERVDIGELTQLLAEQTDTQASVAILPPADNRPPRLSPEEFRSQRAGRPAHGHRDGRGKGQQQSPAENEQFQASSAYAGDNPEAELPASPVELFEETEHPEQPIDSGAAPAAVDLSSVGEEQPKKKKRRSRGGAKRTARKHALRLAAGDVALEADTPTPLEPAAEAPASGDIAADSGIQPEGKKSTVIVKSTPVKRGGRRNGPGRIPRAELFAPAAENSVEGEALPSIDAELPVFEATSSVAETTEARSDVLTDEQVAVLPKSRNNRNRGRKPVAPFVDAGNGSGGSAPNNEPAVGPETGSAEQSPRAMKLASDAPGNFNSFDNQDIVSTLAPEAPTSNDGGAEVSPAGAGPAPARRSSRPKRAVSGARTEKPAVDVPVVPVPDALQMRTQVAAGRMMGSSASLIKPTAEVRTKPTKTKAVAPKQSVVAPKAVVPRGKPTKSTPKPSPVAPEAKTTAPATPPPAAKRRPAPKPKPTAAEPTVPKAKASKKPAKPA